MEFTKCFFIIWFVFWLSQSRFVQGLDQRYNSDLLNVFLLDYAYKSVAKPRTGTLYTLSLPSNFSGMRVSFVRFRTKSFSSQGLNLSSFYIPSSTSPSPFVRRFDLFYENLGNWSSYYFNVPNYMLVSPVIGLLVYNSTNSTVTRYSTLNLRTQGVPILIRFPLITLPEGLSNVTMECVRFGKEGSVEITSMTTPKVCYGEEEGHYAVMIRSTLVPPVRPHKKKEMFWKWWVIGFGVGIVGLVALSLLCVLMYKCVKRKRMLRMVKESERSEALGTTWIGNSRMPSAEGMRTQPVLMNEEGSS